ncbi:extensin-like [Penaeus chinensis]|uniref:extensin-like n=1 Tax=Penaeus chinensis TaxID=139456 RepID=UPI001FB59783|nr:extensin-like [Penaeus chinensis]
MTLCADTAVPYRLASPRRRPLKSETERRLSVALSLRFLNTEHPHTPIETTQADCRARCTLCQRQRPGVGVLEMNDNAENRELRLKLIDIYQEIPCLREYSSLANKLVRRQAQVFTQRKSHIDHHLNLSPRQPASTLAPSHTLKSTPKAPFHTPTLAPPLSSTQLTPAPPTHSVSRTRPRRTSPASQPKLPPPAPHAPRDPKKTSPAIHHLASPRPLHYSNTSATHNLIIIPLPPLPLTPHSHSSTSPTLRAPEGKTITSTLTSRSTSPYPHHYAPPNNRPPPLLHAQSDCYTPTFVTIHPITSTQPSSRPHTTCPSRPPHIWRQPPPPRHLSRSYPLLCAPPRNTPTPATHHLPNPPARLNIAQHIAPPSAPHILNLISTARLDHNDGTRNPIPDMYLHTQKKIETKNKKLNKPTASPNFYTLPLRQLAPVILTPHKIYTHPNIQQSTEVPPRNQPQKPKRAPGSPPTLHNHTSPSYHPTALQQNPHLAPAHPPIVPKPAPLLIIHQVAKSLRIKRYHRAPPTSPPPLHPPQPQHNTPVSLLSDTPL